MPGRLKQLLPYGGSTIVRVAARTAGDSGLDPVFVVTGCESDEVSAALSGADVRVVLNPEFAAGLGSSLAVGVLAAEAAGAAAAVVLLADEPDIDPDLVERVVSRWRQGAVEAVRVRYTDRPGHPVLLARSTFRRIIALRGDGPIWDRLIASGLSAEEISVDATGPIDIDDPADYQSAIA
jgi:molybdenum cofactor cytidylyltransferase